MRKQYTTYKARALEGVLSALNGKERITVSFEITEGPCAGQRRKWDGWFTTDASIDRTLDSLRHCGWHGESLADLEGLNDNEVEIQCEEETFNGRDGEPRTVEKVAFVNRLQRLNVKGAMDAAALRAFDARMRGTIAAHKHAYGAQPGAPKPTPRGAPSPRRGAAPPVDDMDPDPSYNSADDDLPF